MYIATQNVLRKLSQHEDNIKLLMVYSATIDLLLQVASFGLGPQTRFQAITNAGQLTAHGASHAISLCQLKQALEMLEAGRGTFWSQSLQLRTQFSYFPVNMSHCLTKITRVLGRPMLDIDQSGKGP
jgi:hypothetical protein